MMPNMRLVCDQPKSFSAQIAKPKNPNSSSNLISPLVGTGAEPDLLGSPGTANIPQTKASVIGSTTASTIPSQP